MTGTLVDLVAVGLLASLAFLGLRRGAWEAALHLAALFVAYGGAVLAARGLGAPAAGTLGLPAWAGMAATGCAAFLLAYAAMGAAARRAGRAERGRQADGRPTPASRVVGGLLGASRGAVLLLPLLWLAHLVQGLGASGVAPALPDLSGARLPAVGGAAARLAADRVVDPDDPAQRMTARLVTEPGAAVADARAVLEQPSMVQLRGDPDFWADVQDGRVERALRRRSFSGAMYDAELRNRLAELGLLDARAAGDPTVFRAEMKAVLTEVGRRLQRLREDPAWRELMRDEQLARRLEAGDTLALLGDPRFRDLMGRMTADEGERAL